MMRFLIFLWVLPTTLLGILVGLPWVLSGAKLRITNGVLEIHGGWLGSWLMRRSGLAAMALGYVILGCSSHMLEQLRPHEYIHVRQAERWGILFVPAYLLAGLWQAMKGRHIYYDNPFEQEAFAADAVVKETTGKAG